MEKKFNKKMSSEKTVKSYKRPTMRVVRMKHDAHLLAASCAVGINKMDAPIDL